MTNHEAIETLKANYPDACFEQLREAVDTAIFALQRSTHKALDTISRQDAIDVVKHAWAKGLEPTQYIEDLPSAQPDKETTKRVLWSGWKGMRDTRYKCPNCKKPVRNTDIYCHRCGQKLMFPHIDHTPYVPGEKQELIVRWDDE